MTPRVVTHILYLSEPPGRLPLSGAENHLWILLPKLAEAGHHVVLLVVLWGGGTFEVARRKLDELRAGGIEVLEFVEPKLPSVLGTRLARMTSLARLWVPLRRFRKGVVHHHLDLVHAPYVARLAGCRQAVLTLHNDYPWLAHRSKLWFRALGSVVSDFIAISDRVRTHFVACSGLPPERVTTVHYGVPPPRPGRATREEQGLPVDGYILGFVGRLTEQKNLDALIDAVSGMPDVTLVIVGGGPDAARLAAALRGRGQTNVRLLGPVPDAAKLMPIFDVLCLVSKWEGFGLVLIEAMQRGVPIIGSRRGAIPEILADGARGLLCEPDTASIADAIRTAMCNPAMMRERASKARADVAQIFSVDRMVLGTLGLYERVWGRSIEPAGSKVSR